MRFGFEELTETTTHKEAVSLNKDEHTECSGKLKFITNAFYADVDWVIYQCLKCGKLVETSDNLITFLNGTKEYSHVEPLAHAGNLPHYPLED